VIGETDANHKPAHLYGKLGTPKFARYVKYGDDCYPMANCVDFVQILTAPSDRSFKLKQWEGPMTTFQRDLDETPNGRIKRYQIFYEQESGDFDQPPNQQELLDHVRNMLLAEQNSN